MPVAAPRLANTAVHVHRAQAIQAAADSADRAAHKADAKIGKRRGKHTEGDIENCPQSQQGGRRLGKRKSGRAWYPR